MGNRRISAGFTSPDAVQPHDQRCKTVIIIGLVLLLIGLLAGIAILWTVGLIVLVVGAILWILGAAGREVGGRRHCY